MEKHKPLEMTTVVDEKLAELVDEKQRLILGEPTTPSNGYKVRELELLRDEAALLYQLNHHAKDQKMVLEYQHETDKLQFPNKLKSIKIEKIEHQMNGLKYGWST